MIERNNNLDIAKGIAIYMVVLGHLLPQKSFLWLYIYSFHMPLFVFISGMFFESSYKKGAKQFIGKRVKSLLVPYFIWSTLAWCLNCFGGLVGKEIDYIGQAIEIFIYARSVWFLIVLFIISIIVVFAWEIAMVLKIPRIFILLGIWVVLFITTGKQRILCLYKVSELLPFFVAGIGAKNKVKPLDCLHRKKNVTAIFTVLNLITQIIVVYILWTKNYSFPNGGDSTAVSYIMMYLLGFYGILIIIGVSRICNCYSETTALILAIIGRYSIDIYLLHMFFVYLINHLRIKNEVLLSISALIVILIIIFMDSKFLRKNKFYRISIGCRT